MPKEVYKYWDRDDLYLHLSKQAIDYGINLDLVRVAVYDNEWNPIADYNGCNAVQDTHHPDIACFIHDWRWIAHPYRKAWDIEFRDNLIKIGFSKFRAYCYYFAVRLGWLFYYKWVK